LRDAVAHKGRLRRVRKLIRLAQVPLYREGLRQGVAATSEHDDVPLGEALFRTVIDVGAHRGQFALYAARAFPEAHIYSIEPHEAGRQSLDRLRSFLPQIEILPCAAGDREGMGQLHVSRKTDSSSLLPILDSYVSAFPGTEEEGTVSIQVRKLDELFRGRDLDPPTLLKIDVQGTELAVLRGAEETLRRVDAIFVECSFVEFYRGQALAADVITYLHDRFLLTGIFSVVRNRRGETLQADLLFRRRATELE
jgi:FkbM family methyltransferase